MNFKKIFIYIFIFITYFFIYPNLLFSSILSDLTNDHTLIIEIKNKNKNKKIKDSTNDTKSDTTDDLSDATDDIKDEMYLGNKWYSRQNFFIFHSLEMGLSGTKDFLGEYYLFKYRFKSKTRHSFSISLFHTGYAPGIFSRNIKSFDFNILGGLEYFYKMFSNTEGFFVWSLFGMSNGGFSFNLGLGVGSRDKNGMEIWVSYLHNTGVFSRLEFYFLFFKMFTIRGKIGLDIQYNQLDMEMLNFLNGFYIGIFIKNIFRIEIGGGFTINEYSFFRGFGGINLAFNFP